MFRPTAAADSRSGDSLSLHCTAGLSPGGSAVLVRRHLLRKKESLRHSAGSERSERARGWLLLGHHGIAGRLARQDADYLLSLFGAIVDLALYGYAGYVG